MLSIEGLGSVEITPRNSYSIDTVAMAGAGMTIDGPFDLRSLG
jgi:hypothetical protein